MVKLCAFDVGIKNLSFCVMEKINNTTNILHWKVLDISEAKITCCGHLKNNSICGSIAKLYALVGGSKLGYCETHKKQYVPLDFEKNVTGCLKNHKCQYENKSKCTKNATIECNNIFYCSNHLKVIKNKFIKENSLKKIKKVNCTKENLSILGKRMYELLDSHSEILQVDKIIIENQPSLKNPTMKTISMLLFSYFVMRGIIDKSKNNNAIECIEFISPNGKLKINDSLTKNILKMCKTKQEKYKTTKELGIIYCKELLKICPNSSELIKTLDVNKKQDDMADAFLHAYYYLNGSTDLDNDQFVKLTMEYFTNKLVVKNNVVNTQQDSITKNSKNNTGAKKVKII